MKKPTEETSPLVEGKLELLDPEEAQELLEEMERQILSRTADTMN